MHLTLMYLCLEYSNNIYQCIYVYKIATIYTDLYSYDSLSMSVVGFTGTESSVYFLYSNGSSSFSEELCMLPGQVTCTNTARLANQLLLSS